MLTVLVIGSYYLFFYFLDFIIVSYPENLWFANTGVVGIMGQQNCDLTLDTKARVFILVGQFFQFIRLYFHGPFKYYIGKEHFLIGLDEILNQSMSLMINRMRNSRGDPLFFLAERNQRRYMVSYTRNSRNMDSSEKTSSRHSHHGLTSRSTDKKSKSQVAKLIIKQSLTDPDSMLDNSQ